jgi:sulfate adenylyltransferase
MSPPGADRSRLGFTLFFTGLSGSGKSTLSELVRSELERIGTRTVRVLDGDAVRAKLPPGTLGFSKEHRDRNVRHVGSMAADVTKAGEIALCALIAPYDGARHDVREMVTQHGGFFLVYLATPLQVCEQRDPKGLYKKARAGLISNFTGISDPYEPPTDADLILDTSKLSPAEETGLILRHLAKEGYLPKGVGE